MSDLRRQTTDWKTQGIEMVITSPEPVPPNPGADPFHCSARGAV
jgi:hypothetical protein